MLLVPSKTLLHVRLLLVGVDDCDEALRELASTSTITREWLSAGHLRTTVTETYTCARSLFLTQPLHPNINRWEYLFSHPRSSGIITRWRAAYWLSIAKRGHFHPSFAVWMFFLSFSGGSTIVVVLIPHVPLSSSHSCHTAT